MEDSKKEKYEFFRAVRRGDEDRAIGMLVRGEANINWQHSYAGSTALIFSVLEDRLVLFNYLISRADLDPNILDDQGHTALYVSRPNWHTPSQHHYLKKIITHPNLDSLALTDKNANVTTNEFIATQVPEYLEIFESVGGNLKSMSDPKAKSAVRLLHYPIFSALLILIAAVGEAIRSIFMARVKIKLKTRHRYYVLRAIPTRKGGTIPSGSIVVYNGLIQVPEDRGLNVNADSFVYAEEEKIVDEIHLYTWQGINLKLIPVKGFLRWFWRT